MSSADITYNMTITVTSGTGPGDSKGQTWSGNPFCIVVFLEDRGPVVEELEPLARVIGDADGNWMGTLPAPLARGEALRTKWHHSGRLDD